MTFDVDAVQKILCERLCAEVRLARRPDDALMLRTHFAFPDGDRFPIHVSATGIGGIRLSDRGHTLMHISYDHDINAFLQGTRGQTLERIVNETGLKRDGGSFRLDTSIEHLPEAVFRFGQALTRVHDLTLLSRSHVRSTFYDDLADLLHGLVDEDKIQTDCSPEGLPDPEPYRVDYRIDGRQVPARYPAVPLRRAESRQGASDHHHALPLPPSRHPVRVHPGLLGPVGDPPVSIWHGSPM